MTSKLLGAGRPPTTTTAALTTCSALICRAGHRNGLAGLGVWPVARRNAAMARHISSTPTWSARPARRISAMSRTSNAAAIVSIASVQRANAALKCRLVSGSGISLRAAVASKPSSKFVASLDTSPRARSVSGRFGSASADLLALSAAALRSDTRMPWAYNHDPCASIQAWIPVRGGRGQRPRHCHRSAGLCRRGSVVRAPLRGRPRLLRSH